MPRLIALLILLPLIDATAHAELEVECRRGNERIAVAASGKIRVVGKLPPAARERLSPDGKRLLFVHTGDGDAEIYLAPLAGDGRAEQLTRNQAIDNMPDWAGNSKVLFASTRGGSWQLWMMDDAGRGATQLTRHEHGAWEPRCSPAGDAVTYLVRRKARRFTKLPPVDVARIDLPGNAPRILARGLAVLDMAWSPDGKRLALGLPERLAILDAESGKLQQEVRYRTIDPGLHAHGAYGLQWRPDGKAIACAIQFLGGRMAGTRVKGDEMLYFIALDGGRHAAIEAGGTARPLRWIGGR